jgi:hypothetical protein
MAVTDSEREAVGLRLENTGLTVQRLAAIRDRFPRSRWTVEHENDVPVRMRWSGLVASRV